MTTMVPMQQRSFGRFFHWWAEELTGLLGWQRRSSAAGQIPRYIVCIEQDGFRLIDGKNGAPDIAAHRNAIQPLPAILARLTELGQTELTRSIGLRLPHAACYIRNVEIPGVADTHIHDLLTLDLERNSPFQNGEIYTSYFENTPSKVSGRLSYSQLIIKRSSLSEIIKSIEAVGIQVTYVDCWNKSETAALPINFIQAKESAADLRDRSNSMPIMFAFLALLLTASATYMAVSRYDRALEDIQGQTQAAKAKVQASRDVLVRSKAQLSELTALQRYRETHVAKSHAINELTRLLPDTIWLSDLRFEGAAIDLTGLATSAAGIVRILDQSTAFTDVTLTSAVTFDQQHQRERFSLRMKSRMPPLASPEPTTGLFK